MSTPGCSMDLEALAAALPPGTLVSDPDIVGSYASDKALTITPGKPIALVRPRSTAEVQTAVAWASTNQIPIVPRGAGTGLSGGATAIDGSLVLSTERMIKLSIDTTSMTATVQPGVLNAELKRAAAEHGVWYPPDPSSFETCTIGGNLATNAGGLCCVKYGVTTDYVLGLEVVLADGRAVRVGGRTVKDVAGFDLKRLFVGSEGTLGVITEATLRLRPRPGPVTTIVATFDHTVDAGHAVRDLLLELRPKVLELMDANAIAAVEAVRPMGFEPSVGAVLLAQTDGHGGEPERVAAAFRRAGATEVVVSDDETEGEMLMAARRMAVPCAERLGSVLIEDVCIPVSRTPELVARIADIAEGHDISIPVIGHAGDGNFHPLVVFDPTDQDATARAELAFDEIMATALDLGGTITGEHGVGSLKRHFLEDQLGPDVMDLTRKIKDALDPGHVLNPGKWI